jgi:hypothetical protein
VSRELFIYWRVSRTGADEAVTAVRRAQAALRERNRGLNARLYRRDDAGRDTVTLMETYDGDDDGIGSGLQAAIELAVEPACTPWCLGERHLEIFERLSG